MVDPGFNGTVAGVTLNTGYPGSVVLDRSLTVSKTFTQKAGVFDAKAERLSLKVMNLSGGSFTASSGTTSVASTLKVSLAPAFDANGGTFEFGGGGGVLTCDGIDFHHVTFSNMTGAKTVQSGCDLPLGDNPIAGAGGSIKLNGELSGAGTLTTTGTLTFGTNGSLSGFSGLVVGALTVSGDLDLGKLTDLSVERPFKLTSAGSLTMPAGIASFASSFTIEGGAGFTANGGTVEFDGTASSVISCDGKSFNLVRFANKSGRKTVRANCDLPLGASPSLGSGSASMTLEGALSGSGTLTAQQSLILEDSASLTGFSGLVANSGLTMNGASANFGSYTTFSVAGNLMQKGGTVVAPAGAQVNGQFTLNAGSTFDSPATGAVYFANKFTIVPGATFNAFGSTTVFDGGHSAQISCGTSVLNKVVFAHTTGTKIVESTCNLPLGIAPTAGSGGSLELRGTLSGSGTLSTTGLLTLAPGAELSGFSGLAANDLTVATSQKFGAYSSFAVSGDFRIGAGATFTAPSGTASFGGNFVNEGKFADNGGSVVLNGGDQLIGGNTTFNNLSKVAGKASTLKFAAEDKQTVKGGLVLKGSGAGMLTLESTIPGAPWLVDRQGTAEAEYVLVSHSTNSGTPITATESISGGGNTGWAISGPVDHFVLEAQTTTPTAGAADNLTITAKDAYGNTATGYTGSHNLTFGPLADSPSGAHASVTNSSGTAVNFGTATPISFSSGVATVSSGKNGVMTLVKAGSTSVTVSDGSASNGSGLAITVSPASTAGLALEAQTTTPTAGAADNLTITAKDAYGNTVPSYTGSHKLTFGPLADSPSGAHATVTNSSGTATNFGSSTSISFSSGVATVSGSKNGAMKLVKAGSISVTVSDGTLSNGSGLSVTVSPGSPSRYAWANPTSTGTLSSPCLFTCTGTGLGSSGNFKANVAVTDSLGNVAEDLGSSQFVYVSASGGKVSGGILIVPSSGPAETSSQFTYTPSSSSAVTVTAESLFGTEYTEATASMKR